MNKVRLLIIVLIILNTGYLKSMEDVSSSSGSDSSDSSSTPHQRRLARQELKKAAERLQQALDTKDAPTLKEIEKSHPNLIGRTLINAVRDKEKETLITLLEAEVSPNLHDDQYNYPLEVAVRNKNIEFAAILLDKNAKIDGRGLASKGTTPLAQSIRDQNIPMVTMLLDRGANPNKADDEGCTPLMRAAQKLSEELVAMLLAKKADASLKDIHGWTALEYVTNWACDNPYTHELITMIKDAQKKP